LPFGNLCSLFLHPVSFLSCLCFSLLSGHICFPLCCSLPVLSCLVRFPCYVDFFLICSRFHLRFSFIPFAYIPRIFGLPDEIYMYVTVLLIQRMSSFKCYIKIQFVPHRKHITSPLQSG
jgi:hypothetical protein